MITMKSRSTAVLSCLAGVSAAVVIAFSAYGGAHDEQQRSAGEHQHGANPLIDEMAALDAVFREVVSGVALGDGRRVHEALAQMHGTMEKTHEGVHRGTVTLRKNADRLKDFVAQDRQFHGRLEELAKAAHQNDQGAMLSLTKDLLDRCAACHRDFR
jgi:cytochrome c556